MKVARWGNSLAVRLPRRLVEELGLKEGDEVSLTSSRSGLEMSRDRRREDALERIRTARKPFPQGYTFDRSEIYDAARAGLSPDRGEPDER